MKKYKSAYIIMKALPFHKGHQFLIDTALSLSVKVTVLVCSLESEPIPGEIRYNWVKTNYHNKSNIHIIHFTEEVPQYPGEDPNFWKIWVDIANKHCPDADVIFTSELYGDTYAKFLGIKHHLVDLERKTFPISGTKARKHPFENWDYLPEATKPYFVKRVAIMGPESVGKSTLTKKLANYFSTNFVEEYGRIVYEVNGNKITIDDFIPISNGRQDIEDSLIKKSNKLLFCDTEDLTTWIFSQMYYPEEFTKVEGHFEVVLSNKKPYDLYILLKPDCDAIQDGTRNFLEQRWQHFEVIKKEMSERNYFFVEIGGDWDNRYNQSIKLVKQLLNVT